MERPSVCSPGTVRDGLEATRREVEEAGCRAIAIPTDMSDPQQVEEAADTVTRELGPIDVWVNDAMVTVLSPAVDMTPEDYQRVTNVSYLGYAYGTLAAVRLMRERNKGKIIQVGSALAYRSIPLQSAYCGAKYAIQGFTDSLRSELIHSGRNIDITTLQLPAVNTPQFTWIKCVACLTIRSRFRRSISRRSSPGLSIGPHIIGGASSGSGFQRSRRLSAKNSCLDSPITIWPGPDIALNRPINYPRP